VNVIETTIPEVKIIEPRVFTDDRGFFFESYNQRDFQSTISSEENFVQDNHSRSVKNTLRGLHYQVENPQGKLVRVIIGEVFDVAVDIRRNSPHFGRWVGIKLSAENKRQLWIPPGFAHGFLVMSDCAEVLYKASDFYVPHHERCIIWNDPDINIAWPIEEEPLLSEKDQQGQYFNVAI